MIGNFVLGTQSAFTLLSTSDLKAHLNVFDSSTDALIARYLAAAATHVERLIGMDLRTTQWHYVLDQFPIWASFNWFDRYGNYVYLYPNVGEYAIGRLTQRWQEIPLQRGPVQTVDSITYYDMNNSQQTLSNTEYQFFAPTYFPAKIEPVTFWPTSYPRPNSVTITFTTGYTLATCPESVLHAIELIVGSWWNMREDINYGPGTVNFATGQAVESLLAPFTTYWVS